MIISMIRIRQPNITMCARKRGYGIFDDNDREGLLESSFECYVWFVIGLLRECRVRDLVQRRQA